MTKNKSKAQRGTAVKRAEEIEAQFELYCVNSSVDDSNRGSKGAIEDLRKILEYPELDSSDAEGFRGAISKLEGVAAALAAVKDELGRTELSKISVDPSDMFPWLGHRHLGDDETVTGQIKGRWAVQAVINHPFSAVQVLIQGGKRARKGVDVGDRSVTLASDDDWRPLVAEAANEMRRRTGLLVNPRITKVYGVVNSAAIIDEVADIIEELADAPLPPAEP